MSLKLTARQTAVMEHINSNSGIMPIAIQNSFSQRTYTSLVAKDLLHEVSTVLIESMESVSEDVAFQALELHELTEGMYITHNKLEEVCADAYLIGNPPADAIKEGEQAALAEAGTSVTPNTENLNKSSEAIVAQPMLLEKGHIVQISASFSTERNGQLATILQRDYAPPVHQYLLSFPDGRQSYFPRNALYHPLMLSDIIGKSVLVPNGQIGIVYALHNADSMESPILPSNYAAYPITPETLLEIEFADGYAHNVDLWFFPFKSLSLIPSGVYPPVIPSTPNDIKLSTSVLIQAQLQRFILDELTNAGGTLTALELFQRILRTANDPSNPLECCIAAGFNPTDIIRKIS